MLHDILPPVVSAREVGALDGDVSLTDEEWALVSGALPQRRREFAVARLCAHAALDRLGVARSPILHGSGGQPLWPAGCVGSITHTSGYHAAAVARDEDVLAIGIDAEPNQPLPDGVLRHIASSQERAVAAELSARRPHVHWDRLLFCVKESLYKAWFPVTDQWLGFADADVHFGAGQRPGDMVHAGCDQGCFGATVRVAPANGYSGLPARFEGRWLLRDGILVTAIVAGRAGRVL